LNTLCNSVASHNSINHFAHITSVFWKYVCVTNTQSCPIPLPRYGNAGQAIYLLIVFMLAELWHNRAVFCYDGMHISARCGVQFTMCIVTWL